MIPLRETTKAPCGAITVVYQVVYLQKKNIFVDQFLPVLSIKKGNRKFTFANKRKKKCPYSFLGSKFGKKDGLTTLLYFLGFESKFGKRNELTPLYFLGFGSKFGK